MRDPQAAPPARRRERPPRASFLSAFRHAYDGLVASTLHCRNMRVHLVAGVLASLFAAIAPLEGVERAILLLFVVLVPAAESANTAVEALVDLASPHWSPGARLAKDAAAGAVLLLSAGSVVAFVAVLGPVLPELFAARRALAGPAALAAGTAVATLVLVLPARRVPVIAGAAVGGLAGLGLLLAEGAAPAGVLLAAALHGIASGGAARRRDAPAPPG